MGASPITIMAAQGILSPLAKPLYRYIHIGDSLTQGDGDASNNGFGCRDMTWQTALASNGVLLPVKNGGVGGQTSPKIVARITRDVEKFAPDVVGVTMGANDALLLDASYIGTSLQSAYDTLKAAGVFFFFTNIPPNATKAALVTAINQTISAFCAANGVPFVDWYAVGNDPANAGNWKANYSFDGIHPTSRTSLLLAQANWAVIAPYLTSSRKQRRLNVHSPANLLFPYNGIGMSGAANNTADIDGLFANARTLAQNGYSLTAPYLWNSIYTSSGTAPTVSGAMSTVAGVSGRVWTLTATPNGGGGTAIGRTLTASPAIDLTRFQGRRMRLSFLFGASGFDVDNTAAYLATHNNAGLSAFRLSVIVRDTAGIILNTFIGDPLDPVGANGSATTDSLWQSSRLPLDWGASPFLLGHTYDIDLTPAHAEFNVPSGAHSLSPQIDINFAAGAVSPVSIQLAEIMLVDVGPAQYPQIPYAIQPQRLLKVTGATTLSSAQAVAIDAYRCDATSAAFTVTLPSAHPCRGRELTFKKTDASANAVTVAAAGSETIDGAANVSLAAQYKFVRLLSNGASWDVTGSN